MNNGTRVLLADSNADVRSALRLVIEQRAGVPAIAEADDAICLFSQAAVQQPDFILLEMDLPGLDVSKRSAASSLGELIQTLRAIAPGVAVIAISSQPTAEKVCMQAHADAFLCKSDPPDVWMALLERF